MMWIKNKEDFFNSPLKFLTAVTVSIRVSGPSGPVPKMFLSFLSFPPTGVTAGAVPRRSPCPPVTNKYTVIS